LGSKKINIPPGGKRETIPERGRSTRKKEEIKGHTGGRKDVRIGGGYVKSDFTRHTSGEGQKTRKTGWSLGLLREGYFLE